MRPEEYALIVLRRWWLVLLALAVAAGAAFVFTSRQPATYQVSTQVMAIAQPPDYWLDLYAKNRLASYKDLIGNYDFVAGALQAAGLSVDPGLAGGELVIGHNPDSNTLQLVVRDTDPARAAAIVNAVADAFVAKSRADNQQITQEYTSSDGTRHGTVQIVKLGTPGAPRTPVGPRVKLNTAAGAVLGVTLGIVLAFALEYLDDRLRSERDVARALQLPVLAGIPRQ